MSECVCACKLQLTISKCHLQRHCQSRDQGSAASSNSVHANTGTHAFDEQHSAACLKHSPRLESAFFTAARFFSLYRGVESADQQGKVVHIVLLVGQQHLLHFIVHHHSISPCMSFRVRPSFLSSSGRWGLCQALSRVCRKFICVFNN